MAVTKPTLAQALAAVGVAGVYIGDPFTVGGLALLGVTEGEITFNPDFQQNNLTAPEFTGGIAHQAHVMAGNVQLTVPLIVGDTALWAKIHPHGGKGAGWSSQQPVTPTSVLVVPLSEVGAGLTYNGTAWVPAAPINAVWIWKAYPTPGPIAYRFADGGKVITPVTFTGMFDAARPEGHKVYTIGDPVTAGITTVRL